MRTAPATHYYTVIELPIERVIRAASPDELALFGGLNKGQPQRRPRSNVACALTSIAALVITSWALIYVRGYEVPLLIILIVAVAVLSWQLLIATQLICLGPDNDDTDATNTDKVAEIFENRQVLVIRVQATDAIEFAEFEDEGNAILYQTSADQCLFFWSDYLIKLGTDTPAPHTEFDLLCTPKTESPLAILVTGKSISPSKTFDVAALNEAAYSLDCFKIFNKPFDTVAAELLVS